MTTHREPLHIAIESAPKDRFDDDGPRVYRAVAFLGTGATRRHKVAWTRDHESEGEAAIVLADKILRAANDATQAARLTDLVDLVDRLNARIEALEARPEPKKGRR